MQSGALQSYSTGLRHFSRREQAMQLARRTTIAPSRAASRVGMACRSSFIFGLSEPSRDRMARRNFEQALVGMGSVKADTPAMMRKASGVGLGSIVEPPVLPSQGQSAGNPYFSVLASEFVLTREVTTIENTRPPARWSSKAALPAAAVTLARWPIPPGRRATTFRYGGHKAHLGFCPSPIGGGFGPRRFWHRLASNNAQERRSLNRRPRFELKSQLLKLASRLSQVGDLGPDTASRLNVIPVLDPNLLAHAGLHQPNRRATA